MSEIRVARIISRLNIGGPAIQAITMTRLLDPLGYESLLIRGSEADHEGSMDHLAEQLDVAPLRIPAMRRELGLRDVVAFVHLVHVLRRFRPDVVHTHAAKAGTLGRFATLVAGRGRPAVIVHTFHGHSLSGYFSSPKAALFLHIERFLARHTTRLVAVSEEVRDDLVRLGVAAPEQIDVIHLGFDLSRFQTDDASRARRRSELRASLAIPPDARVVTIIARLVPIKRVDRFLRIAERLAHEEDIWFLIAGDGELRDELQAIPLSPGLRKRVVWAGFQHDVPGVCFASDVVVLTSDNEGTPVSLIEAQAAGVPVVSTRVGGAATVVGASPRSLVAPDDVPSMARAIGSLLDDLPVAREAARASADRVVAQFSLDALVRALDELYRRELRRSRQPGAADDAPPPAGEPAVRSNVDEQTVQSFGEEWSAFDQSAMSSAELEAMFGAYFSVFPWDSLRADAEGFDLGCGSGRWARLVAPRVGVLHCIDASSAALDVARSTLRDLPNCRFHLASVDAIPLAEGSMDFGYSLGVLHHVPDTMAAITSAVRVLKPGAPLLLYLYYALENRPWWYRALWRASDRGRRVFAALPHRAKLAGSTAIAAVVYLPLARLARGLERRGRSVEHLPLTFYRHRSFYTIRTDAYDRFSTPLEQRFTAAEIREMMLRAGLEDIVFSAQMPYWCAVGRRARSGA